MNPFEQPIYLLTSDQDWAPPWAMGALLDAVGELPLHLFRTNPCPAADEAFRSGSITQGWHPNLLPRSSHGNSSEEIIDYMTRWFPNCNTARNHAYFTGTHFDRLLYEAGIRIDSQTATMYQPRLMPLTDISGTLRLPVYFEDDVFFHHHAPLLDIASIRETLSTPGLKIFNIHATFIACNTPSSEHYAKNREHIFGSTSPMEDLVHPKRGSRTVLLELIELIENEGGRFQCFQTFANELAANHSLI